MSIWQFQQSKRTYQVRAPYLYFMYMFISSSNCPISNISQTDMHGKRSWTVSMTSGSRNTPWRHVVGEEPASNPRLLATVWCHDITASCTHTSVTWSITWLALSDEKMTSSQRCVVQSMWAETVATRHSVLIESYLTAMTGNRCFRTVTITLSTRNR